MKLDVDYWTDPKWKGLGTTHEALYVRLLGYTRKWDTDGFIPGAAVALCGRKVYGRDRVIADLVEHGLLERSDTEDGALVFPKSWHKFSAKHDTSSHQIAGQDGRSQARREEKRRDRYIYPDRSTLAPERMRPDEAIAKAASLGPCSDCGMVQGNHLAECRLIAKKGKEGDDGG
jgi:hypothetical protein